MNASILSRIGTGGNIKDYLIMMYRRRWLIAVAFLSVFLTTAWYVYRIEDVYESYAVLVIEQPKVAIDQLVTPGSGRSLSYYQGILNSRSFQEMVVDSVGLPTFTNSFPKFAHDNALAYIQKSIDLRPTEYSSFLRLNVRAKSRELAYGIACAATEFFRSRCQEVETEESRQALAEIEKQLKVIRTKLEEAEHDYRTYIDQIGAVDKSGNMMEGTTQELSALQEAYAGNLAQLGVKEADLEAEKRLLASLEAKVTPQANTHSPEYLELRSKLSELEKEKLRLQNLGIQLSSASTIDREIADIEHKLVEYKQPAAASIDPRLMQQWQELRKSVVVKESDLDLFTRRLEAYRKSIANYKKENPNILTQSLELLRLKRSKEIYENVYGILLQKSEEERIRSASSGASIKIVDLPRDPHSPIPKNQSRYYLIGIIIGLALGFGLMFFAEFNDTTIKSNEDIEKYLEIPVMGTIPHIVVSKKDDIQIRRRSSSSKKQTSVVQYPRSLLNFKGDDSVITEAYRSLRTNLSFVSPDKPLRSVLLTSAGPSEGKSLTIANLAMAYAQMGRKTLLIDTDLRRPVMHHLFQIKREPGFSELFVDTEPDYNKVIRESGRENLSLITAGMFTPNPAELIGSQRMVTHLEYFENHYDMVFFDTPPVVAVTDATLLATKVDGVLLIVKSHHTDREVALRAINIMSNVGIKVMGAVLNDINLSNRYSSYGYYKYYYHYYKSKTD
jgi:capsular exopolysaccharide synthesis family protein